jgi:hypothetical protein
MNPIPASDEESTADRELIHSRLINAPRERVFRAFAELAASTSKERSTSRQVAGRWYALTRREDMGIPELQSHRLIDQADLRAEIQSVVHDADLWMSSPNDQLGGLAPRDLLQTLEDRLVLHSLVQSIKHGMTT